jgi:RNase P subunit RPR2
LHRVCIAVGEVQCDACHRFLNYGERYLIIEDESGEAQRFCIECGLNRGYASYQMEKGEQIITFPSR